MAVRCTICETFSDNVSNSFPQALFRKLNLLYTSKPTAHDGINRRQLSSVITLFDFRAT
jgi:hypothetical protein